MWLLLACAGDFARPLLLKCRRARQHRAALLDYLISGAGQPRTGPQHPTARTPAAAIDADWNCGTGATLSGPREATACPSLASKHVTPHVLRHTCAMDLLISGVDVTVISMWLGHESLRSTQIYLTAHMALKEQALARLTPAGTTPGRYIATDDILAFLDSL
jgi:integrase